MTQDEAAMPSGRAMRAAGQRKTPLRGALVRMFDETGRGRTLTSDRPAASACAGVAAASHPIGQSADNTTRLLAAMSIAGNEAAIATGHVRGIIVVGVEVIDPAGSG